MAELSGPDFTQHSSLCPPPKSFHADQGHVHPQQPCRCHFFRHCRVSGLSPFMGDTDLETMANVTIAEYDYEDEAFDKVGIIAEVI